MRKGDETKREILRAAEQLFCQKGYEAASMQEIVRAAGVSKGVRHITVDGKKIEGNVIPLDGGADERFVTVVMG